MKRILLFLLVLSLSFSLCACGSCQHEFQAASCTAPATCSKCGEVQGEALGHDWMEATCTEAKTCLQCGITAGEALGHSPASEATCTEASVCSVCGKTIAEAKGHEWQEATCIVLKTCSVCGETEGDYAEHDYSEATCIAPMTCKVCGQEEGELSTEHSWKDATCADPQTCSLCGKTSGRALGHDYAAATCTKPKTCTRCGDTSGSAKGHRAGSWTVTVQATKDSAGTRVKKCSVCGATVESESFRLTDAELIKQFKSTCTASYDDLARSPDLYKNTYVMFSGRVVQVISEAASSQYYSVYRVATKGRYDNVMLVYIDNYGTGSRILEGDTISFYGKSDGLYTYKTVMGSTLTIPSVKAEIFCQGKV